MTYPEFLSMIEKEIDSGIYSGSERDLSYFMVCLASLMMFGTAQEILFECECYERR